MPIIGKLNPPAILRAFRTPTALYKTNKMKSWIIMTEICLPVITSRKQTFVYHAYSLNIQFLISETELNDFVADTVAQFTK